LIRNSSLPQALGMATLKQKIAAERAVREMLEDNGLPEPDQVEYGYGCIRFLFVEPKLAVVIDIDDFPADYDGGLKEYDDMDSADGEAA
jgi:hypothetical protein